MTPVGLTSRWVAANRALETESPNPLYSDPCARQLAGEPGFWMMSAARASDAIDAQRPDPYLTIRTKFYDDSILGVVRESSIQQVVILAAGMDARGLRLDWPDGLVLFEVDRDEIFEHKEAVLSRLHAKPTCDRRIVRADLAGDWPEELVKAGFASSRPAAFLIEGLLMYLDEPAVARLFAAMKSVATEGSWMADHGWQGTIVQAGEPAANFGRWPYPVAPRHVPGLPRTYLISARRNRSSV
jgi:methyltransferase (TIGR00027 family)